MRADKAGEAIDDRRRKVWDVAAAALLPAGRHGAGVDDFAAAGTAWAAIFCISALGAGAIGLVLGRRTGAVSHRSAAGSGAATAGSPRTLLWPMLFITIACGACSGFHSLIASGTTRSNSRTRRDAEPIGYGTMLMEGMVAIVSLCCVMMFAAGSTN